MAELDQVYGGMGGGDNEINHHQQEDTEYESRHHREIQQNHEPKSVQNQIEYPIPQQYNMPQQAPPKRQFAPSYSFWDRMTLKRVEVIKLAMFSLVILLAIAIDKISNHYLSKYISENVLSETQEFILRLSYPIVIFLVLWIAKSL